MRKGENKNYRLVPFLLGAEQKMPKKAKKIKKIQLWHYFTPKQFGKGHEREKIKIIVSFRSTRRGIENAKKKAKKLKNTILASFKASRLEKAEKERK